MVIVLVPRLLILDKICSCDPRPNATTEITEVMPITIPNIVNKARNLWAKIALIAILNDSAS